MDDIPREARELMNQPELLEGVERIPGSDRLRATVLGLSVIRQLNEEKSQVKGPGDAGVASKPK